MKWSMRGVILLLWCCWWWPASPSLLAVEIIDGPHVEFNGGQALVKWKTDSVSGSKVRFGLSADQLETRSGDGVTMDHQLVIEGLKPGSTYYFTVGTAKRVLQEGKFTTPVLGQSATTAPATGPRAPPAERVADGRAASREKAPAPAAKVTPAAPVHTPPSVRAIWGSLDSLEDHYERHGPDFKATSADDYARQSWLFLQRAIDEGLPAKQDPTDGTVRVYDPKTGAFAAYRRDGKTRTYFKPGGRDYFSRQPGNPVRLKRASR